MRVNKTLVLLWYASEETLCLQSQQQTTDLCQKWKALTTLKIGAFGKQ